MDFNILFSVLKKHLSGGETIPYFFRELMEIITDVSEEEWGTSREPGKVKDETIRTYIKNARLPKKLACKIISFLNLGRLKERINEKSQDTLESLAEDLKVYDSEISKENVAEKVSQWMGEIIKASAGAIRAKSSGTEVTAKKAFHLKSQYGHYLVNECGGICPCHGCDAPLQIMGHGQLEDCYEVSLIDKNKKGDVNNLIALCPKCYAEYQIDHKKKSTKEMKSIKRVLAAHQENRRLLEGASLDKGIQHVITKISDLGEDDLSSPSFEPIQLHKKLDPHADHLLYIMVNSFVTSRYSQIREIMVNADKSQLIHYNVLQNQIHGMYLQLAATHQSKLDIFNELTEKLKKITKQDTLSCQAVIAFFIEKCEVFDAAAQ